MDNKQWPIGSLKQKTSEKNFKYMLGSIRLFIAKNDRKEKPDDYDYYAKFGDMIVGGLYAEGNGFGGRIMNVEVKTADAEKKNEWSPEFDLFAAKNAPKSRAQSEPTAINPYADIQQDDEIPF